ncbi:MAG: hypothetical protein JST68_21540 [Bacteroidetes bacterium]|nr:hypothetical protein [Bacteroidota bacterium]
MTTLKVNKYAFPIKFCYQDAAPIPTFVPHKPYQMSTRPRKITFLISVLAFLIPTFLIERNILQHTGGEFTLPWDGSFTNIAVGKNLAFFGVWGLSKSVFQAASSSILYPLTLVPFFFIAGAHLIIALIVNGIAAAFLLWVLQREMIRRGLSPMGQLAILLMIVFCLPLPLLVISGMEFTLFLLILALFVIAFSRPLHWRLYVYGALLVAVRYEGLLIVAAFAGLLLYRKQQVAAARLLLAAIVPIVGFGLISLSKESPFLPPALLQIRNIDVYAATIIGTILIIGVVFVPLPYKKPWLACSVLGIIALVRTWEALGGVTAASVGVWRQQMEVAKFVRRYYNRYGVSVNEIGVVSYFTDGRKVDLTGVANYSPKWGMPKWDQKKRFHWSPLTSDSLSYWEGAMVAIMTGPKSDEKPVGRWGKVASWNNIHFYALDTSIARRLRNNLRDYEKTLPTSVQVQYY